MEVQANNGAEIGIGLFKIKVGHVVRDRTTGRGESEVGNSLHEDQPRRLSNLRHSVQPQREDLYDDSTEFSTTACPTLGSSPKAQGYELSRRTYVLHPECMYYHAGEIY